MGGDCCGPPEPQTKVPLWKYLGLLLLMCGGGLPMLLPMLDTMSANLGVLWADLTAQTAFGAKGYVELYPDSPELGAVFFSGQPWLVLCNRAKVSVPAGWIPIAEHLAATDTPDAFNMATLDCRLKLPSGKSVYERFNLTPPDNYSPHALLAYNGRAPKLIENAWALGDSKPYGVANFVTGLTAKTRFTFPAMTSMALLEAKCLKMKACGVVLHEEKMTAEEESEIMLPLLKQYARTIRWVKLDVSRMALSVEQSLPQDDSGKPRLLVFKRRRGAGGGDDTQLTARAYKGQFDAAEMSPFLEGLLKDDASSWTVLKQTPNIVKRTDFNTKLYADPKKTPKLEL